MRALELELQSAFPQFRRIWVQYSNYRGYRMCITLFPQGNGHYHMVFGMLNEITFDSVSEMIRQDLEMSN